MNTSPDYARFFIPRDRALIRDRDVKQQFIFHSDNYSKFTGVVFVSFSAFDPFEPLIVEDNRTETLPFAYVGLKEPTNSSSSFSTKSHSQLTKDFIESAAVCVRGEKKFYWKAVLEQLESDYYFKSMKVSELADLANPADQQRLRQRAFRFFDGMSTGHKIVLLTLTRLVETVSECGLVFIDEPEAHLHPPLLSTFIRAISDFLVKKNGVAIVATHSPVVLQEVPRNCVWKITRDGEFPRFSRPNVETFGESVALLTDEVFRLELEKSGFYGLLKKNIFEDTTLDGLLERFNGQLGSEARSVAASIIFNLQRKKKEEEKIDEEP